MRPAASALLAARFLFGRRSRSGRRLRGGVIGVGLSLVPLVVVMQVTGGMIAGITSRFIEAGSYHVQAIARDEPDDEELVRIAEVLLELPGVELVAAERQGIALASTSAGRTGVTIRAVESDLWERDPGLRRYVSFLEGEWSLDDEQSILLGEAVARALDARVGDQVRVMTARPLSGGRLLPRTTTFTVRGIFSSGYADLDRLWTLVSFDRGSRILPAETSRTLLGIKVAAPLSLPNPLFSAGSESALQSRSQRLAHREATALLVSIRAMLGGRYRVLSWFDAERPKYMSFKTTRDLLIFIMVLIVIVATLNVSAALVMLVLEKQEEIAVLKSLGASPAGVRLTFVMAGSVLGALGMTAGLIVGLLLAVNINEVLHALEWLLNAVSALFGLLAAPFGAAGPAPVTLLSGEYYLESIPIDLRFGDLLLVAVLTVLLSSLAAFFPARRAAAVRPLETLRRH